MLRDAVVAMEAAILAYDYAMERPGGAPKRGIADSTMLVTPCHAAVTDLALSLWPTLPIPTGNA